MSEAARLLVKASLDTRDLDSGLDQTSERFGGLGAVAKGALIGAGAAAAGAAVKGVLAFADFESSMNEVFTLLPGISSEAMSAMESQVKKFSTEFGVLPEKTVPALYQALSAGVPQDNVFTFLGTSQKAAKGGVTDLTTAVDGISSVVNAYGSEVISAAEASDLMFTAVRLGKTNFEELSQSLFQVNPIASALGVDFGDVTAAMAAMTAQGTPTSVATTQLRQAFVEMSKEGSKTSETFKVLSGESFKDFIDAGGNTQQALQLLEEHAAATGVGINDLFGSVEAGQAALALTGGGTEKFSLALDEMGKSGGATEEAFQQMNRGIGPVFDQLRASASVAMLELGKRVLSVTEAIGGFVDKNQGWLLPAAAAVATIVGGALATAFIRWGIQSSIAAGKAVAAFLTTQASAIGATVKTVAQIGLQIGKWALLGAQALIHAAKVAAAWMIAMGPIALVIAAVAGLVAAIVIHWDTIKAAIGAAWDWVKEKSAAVWDAITGAVMGAVNSVVGFLSGAWETIKAAAGGAWDWVTERVNSFIGFFTDLPGRITNLAAGMFDGLKNAFRSAINFIIRGWNSLQFKIPGFSIGPVSFGGFTLGVPDIPFLAHGGRILSAGAAIVGEAGPELLSLPRGATVAPLGGGGAGGVNVYINVEGSLLRTDELARQLADPIRSALIRSGIRASSGARGL